MTTREQYSPTIQSKLNAAIFGACIVLMVAVPAIALWQPRPARFGWQMYSAIMTLPDVAIERADGTLVAVDLEDMLARNRAEADFSGAIAAHLCAVTDAVAVHVTVNETERRSPCA